MPYDPRNDPRFTLEGISRQAARDLIETIVMNAQSEADVQQVIEQMLGYMREEWAQVPWYLYKGEFGDDPLKPDDDRSDEAGGF